MASKLTIEVVPDSALTESEQEKLPVLFARLLYTCTVTIQSEDDESISETHDLPSSLREALDNKGETVLEVEDNKDGSSIYVRIESSQGAILWTSADLKDSDLTQPVEIEKDILIKASTRKYPDLQPVLRRSGRFVILSELLGDFEKYSLYATSVEKDTSRENAAKTLLNQDGNTLINSVTKIEADDNFHKLVVDLYLRPVKLRSDGTFEIEININGKEAGWLWMLIGPQLYAGYVVDGDLLKEVRNILVTLPSPDEEKKGDASTGNGNGSDNGCSESKNGKARLPYFDFDETLIADNPELFSQDLGTSCKPFRNPQRILGERSFHTILRVDQPDIGGRPSLTLEHIPGLLHTPDYPRPALSLKPAHIMAAPMSSATTTAVPSETGVFSFIANLFKPKPEPVAVPGPMVAGQVVAVKPNLMTLMTSRRKPISEDNPIRWEGYPGIYQSTSLAGGHVLEWRVQWRSNGYSLGNVAHSLTLAPRQKKRIASLSWSRREEAARREITQVTEEVDQETTRNRDYNDAVQSSLSEWSKGGSKSSTTGAAGGIGFAMGPVVIGGGAAHGQSSSSSWQRGGRDVSASEQQSLRDAIRQHGESIRRNESSVVTEVTQEEEIEGVSEVVRNPNYCHSLTVIYHEILRHLRVDTIIANVRECLFVPFSIRKFDYTRALRWRDLISKGLLKRSLRWTLSYLDEIVSNFSGSSIPAGKRCEHQVNFLNGSIYIQMAIERPEDPEEEEYNEAMWNPFGFLLPYPGRHIFNTLRALSKQHRDRYFQRDVAPTMAARLADKLILKAGSQTIEGVDFTLATGYRFNRTVRVDFSCSPAPGTLNRKRLQNLKVLVDPEVALPKGSVANVKHGTIRYFTESFNRNIRSVSVTDDLVDIESGTPKSEGATLFFPLTSWDNQDLRDVIRRGVDLLIEHLNEHVVHYHKVIWWYMDRDEIYMMLDGFTIPQSEGRSIASVVEREPMAILGNTLVFRVASGAFLGIDNHESPEMLKRYYIDFENQQKTEPIRISLPTEGLYAQAIMDDCEACEEHLGTTDWVLNDKDPELEDLLPAAFEQRRAEPKDLTPTEFQTPLINLQNAPAAPDPTGLASILSAVTKSDSFRDMAGLAGTQANAMGALTQAASLAQSFGQMAVDFQKSKQGTADAKQKLSNIQKAKSEGLIDDAEAKRQSTRALDDQNMAPERPQLTEDPPLTEALHRAADSGQPIEVSRHTKQGEEIVKIGQSVGDVTLASHITDAGQGKATKLPTLSGSQAAQAWESLSPIAPRVPGDCPKGMKNLGTILFIHDAETRIDWRDHGKYTDADAWMLVHTISDLVEGLRSYVGNCGYVTGIHIQAHGGFRSSGGFRMGDDTDGNGHVEPNEAKDMVSTASQAAKFGSIIKNALYPGGNAFISVAGCESAGTGNNFLTALHNSTGAITIASPGDTRSGGNWWHKSWWEVDGGRIQINVDGTTKTDSRNEGTGIWRPF